MIHSRILLAASIVLFGFMQGCTMVQTYPLAARPGDTITLAPGSLDGATKTNITVQYYSNSNPSVPINLSSNIRSVFNITPDRTSPAWLTSLAGGMTVSSGHAPWQTVIALNLPTSGLPSGDGYLRVTLGSDVITPSITHNPNTVNIALTILPGTGIPNPFQYLGMWFQAAAITGDLNDLMPGKQYVLKTNPTDPGDPISYAAAEYILYMPFRNTSNGLPPTAEDVSTYVAVILDTQPNHEFYQLGMRWRQNGDNIIVNVTSPLLGGASRQTRISIVMNKASPFIFYGIPTISSAKFFDENGNVIPSTQLPRLVGINL